MNQVSDLLHPSPPLRRRKASKALREETSESATENSIMSNAGGDQGALYGHNQDHAAKSSDNVNTYLTLTQRGKMPKARDSQNAFTGEEQVDTAEISQNNATFTSSEDQALTPSSSGFPKAIAVLDYGEKDKSIPKKSMTDQVTSPKASHGKKSLRHFFHRKGSKESTTPTSSSGKTAGRRIISAPTLVDASPGAKHVVNYSRPIVPHSSSDVSNGSPVGRGSSNTELHASKPFSGPGKIPGGLTDNSGHPTINVNTSLVSQHPNLRLPNANEVQIQEHSNTSVVQAKQAADEHGAISKPLATEKDTDASDNDSFNPSDYSGDENSVQQAVAVPIVFSGRAKLVDIRPPRGTNTAAPANRRGMRSAIPSGTTYLTDQEAEALGVQDAERYLKNAMTSQTRPTYTTTDDPFIDPAFQNLLAKPANEIAAKEMARIKAAREAGRLGDGLMEGMNALRAKSDAKPGVQNTGNTIANPRTNAGESSLSKMRALKKKSKREQEQEDSEHVVRKVQADVQRGLREESEIKMMIKAKLAVKDAANRGVRGAGIPRIDYGPPDLGTALGGNAPTEAERAHARAITAHRTADQSGGSVQDNGDNITGRGHFEGC